MTLSFTGKEALFEEWYPYLENVTPSSTMLELTEEEKNVIQVRNFNEMCEQIPYFQEMNDSPEVLFTKEEESVIWEALVKKVAEHIHEPVFFRTNIMSPKDVKGNCIVKSAEEALLLLVSSHRMYKGFCDILKDLPLVLVFRQVITMKEEFRCFIQEGKVKAISQYCDSNDITKGRGASVIYPYKEEDWLHVYRYVLNTIKEVNIKDAVVDVASTPEGFTVIELNPFSSYTDRSLFVREMIYGEPIQETRICFWSGERTLTTYTVKHQRVQLIEDEEITEPVRRELSLESFLQNIKEINPMETL